MEIGAASTSSYLPPQLTEPRVARSPVRETSGTQENAAAINKVRNENSKPTLQPTPVLTSQVEASKTVETSQVAAPQVTRTARNEQENPVQPQTEETQRPQQQEVTLAAGGSIKMDVEDGNRVLQVYDSKDVLIYQLPPKGALMLIKAQENAQQSQVQTSA
jgi:hypothetical protein